MKTSTLTKFVAAVALLTVLACSVAQAGNFLFSFPNDPNGPEMSRDSNGDVFVLPHNGTGPATEIQIFSYPAGLVQFGSYTPPIDVFLVGHGRRKQLYRYERRSYRWRFLHHASQRDQRPALP